MLGYDYDIIYKNGKENLVVEAWSRKYVEKDLLLLYLYHTRFNCRIQQEWLENDTMVQLIQILQEDTNPLRVILGCRIPYGVKGVFFGVELFFKMMGVRGVTFIPYNKSLWISKNQRT
jgi:hypothetical protein